MHIAILIAIVALVFGRMNLSIKNHLPSVFLVAIPLVVLIVLVSGALAAFKLTDLIFICVALELARAIAIVKFYNPKAENGGYAPACFSFFIAESVYFLVIASLVQGDNIFGILLWTNWQDALFSIFISLFSIFAALAFTKNGKGLRQIAVTVIMLVALRYGFMREFEGHGLLRALPSEWSGFIVCGVLVVSIGVAQRRITMSKSQVRANASNDEG